MEISPHTSYGYGSQACQAFGIPLPLTGARDLAPRKSAAPQYRYGGSN